MANQFKRNIGKPVSKQECLSWIESYQKNFQSETRSIFYGRDAIEKILSNQSLSGISFFFCRKADENGKPYNDLVLVGTYEDGTLDWKPGDEPGGKDGGGDGPTGYNNGMPCPPACPK